MKIMLHNSFQGHVLISFLNIDHLTLPKLNSRYIFIQYINLSIDLVGKIITET